MLCIQNTTCGNGRAGRHVRPLRARGTRGDKKQKSYQLGNTGQATHGPSTSERAAKAKDKKQACEPRTKAGARTARKARFRDKRRRRSVGARAAEASDPSRNSTQNPPHSRCRGTKSPRWCRDQSPLQPSYRPPRGGRPEAPSAQPDSHVQPHESATCFFLLIRVRRGVKSKLPILRTTRQVLITGVYTPRLHLEQNPASPLFSIYMPPFLAFALKLPKR